MKTTCLTQRRSFCLLAMAALGFTFGPDKSLQAAGPPQEQGMVRRVTNFFRGLVGQEPEPAPYRYQQPQPPQYRPPSEPRRYNLDMPPPAARGGYAPPPPDYRQAPQQPYMNRAPSGQRDGEDYDRPAQPRKNQESRANELEPAPMPEEKKSTKPVPAPQKSAAEPKKTPEPKPEPKVEDTPPPPQKKESESAKPEPKPEKEEPASPNMPSSASSNSNDDSTATAPSKTSSSGPLVGTKTSKPGRVKSPYPPYNELDVTGLSSGSLAMDPTTQKVFRVP